MSSEYYNDAWYDDRWASLPPVMRKIAADTIKKAISDEDFELIRRKHAEHGHDWIHFVVDQTPEQVAEMNAMLDEEDVQEHGWPAALSGHHGFGTQIRNLLRDKEFGAGISDDDLPEAPYEDWKFEGVGPRNWDDYYVQAIEAAAGLREV